MLICLAILLGGIFGYKVFKGYMIKRYMAANKSPAITVSTTKVEYSSWQPKLTSYGSLRAIRGVNITTQLAGMVQTIYFTPGATVKQGTLLVQLNIDPDVAQLHSLQANATLASITYNRDKAQYAAKGVSKEQVDTDQANLASFNAQVAEQIANIAKKTIVAPFTGRIGVSAVNPGQFLNPGDTVTSIQQLDPLYMDFYVPQQALVQLHVGQPVGVSVDTFQNKTFSGKITTIEPIVDVNSRNVEIEATLSNPQSELLPGMFATVVIQTGTPNNYLTLPQTAITFNSYGNIVYVVSQTGKDKNGKPILTVTQTFVKTGQTRGDQIKILDGLKKGDTVVTSGQLKLKNGSTVVINNSIQPPDNPNPNLIDD